MRAIHFSAWIPRGVPLERLASNTSVPQCVRILSPSAVWISLVVASLARRRPLSGAYSPDRATRASELAFEVLVISLSCQHCALDDFEWRFPTVHETLHWCELIYNSSFKPTQHYRIFTLHRDNHKREEHGYPQGSCKSSTVATARPSSMRSSTCVVCLYKHASSTRSSTCVVGLYSNQLRVMTITTRHSGMSGNIGERKSGERKTLARGNMGAERKTLGERETLAKALDLREVI